MLDKYGWRVTAPSQPTGAQRETILIEVRGVGFRKIAVDFLAFLGAMGHGDGLRSFGSALPSVRYDFARLDTDKNKKAVEVYTLTLLPTATNPASFQTFNFFHALDYTRQNIFNTKHVNTL